MATPSYINNFFSNMEIGKEYHFKIYAYDNSYLHKVVIKCGSYSLNFEKVKGGVETKFTVPETWANAMPNANSLSGTITTTTYRSNYSTVVGSNDVKSVKFNIPSSMKPSVSLTITEADDGIAGDFEAFIQTKSKVKVVVTAAGINGSTIKSYKTTLDGATYSSATFTSSALTTSGTLTATTTVTDSRGKTATASVNITVLPYAAPTIYYFTCNRANDVGEPDDEGQYLYTKYHYKIASCNNLNESSYKLEYKLKEATEWIRLLSGTAYEMDDEITTAVELLDTEESYDIRLTISDYFTTRYAYFELGTAFTLMDINKSGKALAFGKVSEIDEGVEFGMKAWFKNGEAPNGAVDIPNSTDLNNVMDEGFYCIPTSSVSGSITNKPYEGNATGILIVLRAGNEGQRAQIFLRCTKEVSELYIRWFYYDEWGSWVRI